MAGGLEDDISKIVATLAELYDVEGDAQTANLLRQAEFELDVTDYDNWNGGTYTYSLLFKTAPRPYAQLGDKVSSVE